VRLSVRSFVKIFSQLRLSYGYRVNLGCVEGLDPRSLDLSLIEGRSMPLSDNPGPYPGNDLAPKVHRD
jgi:hypothetical protein